MSTSRITIDEVKQRLFAIHGNAVTIDESTFINMTTKCRFIDKDYGSWWSKPYKVVNQGQGHIGKSAEKAKRTFLKKYGVDNPLKCDSIKDKIRKTCTYRYGKSNPAQVAEFKKKAEDTNMRRYGCPNPLQNDEISKKKNSTNLKRYGYVNPMMNAEIHKKAQQTLVDNYGVIVPYRNKDICRKGKETCMNKYGVDNPSKNHDIAQKSARNQTRATKLKHWMTGGEIVCIGSYEVKVVEYLNANHIEYLWQPQTFSMPPDQNGKIKTYRPDLYLSEQDKWIEIKGYFRKDAQAKWDWFHLNYINSELWNESKLIELGML